MRADNEEVVDVRDHDQISLGVEVTQLLKPSSPMRLLTTCCQMDGASRKPSVLNWEEGANLTLRVSITQNFQIRGIQEFLLFCFVSCRCASFFVCR